MQTLKKVEEFLKRERQTEKETFLDFYGIPYENAEKLKDAIAKKCDAIAEDDVDINSAIFVEAVNDLAADRACQIVETLEKEIPYFKERLCKSGIDMQKFRYELGYASLIPI